MTSFVPGDRGLGVRAVQERLVAHGVFVTLDGDYGPKTAEAVKQFQRSIGFVDSGVVTPQTFAALMRKAARVAPAPGETVLVHGLELPATRCWPLRALPDGRRPIVTSKHRSVNGSRPNHLGADLLYRYLPGDPPMRVGDSGRTPGFWIPPETWSVSPADGVVERCGSSPSGLFCWVRHAGGLATGGFHHDLLAVVTGQLVKMGDRIGRVNDNPKDLDPDHLHGELYRGGLVGSNNTYPAGTLDPEIWWGGARLLPAV